jgi:hypothetical protein
MQRNMVIQNYIIYRIWNNIINYIDNTNIKIHSKQADELIFEINTNELRYTADFVNNPHVFKSALNDIIQTHFQLYSLSLHRFETSSGNILSVYKKRHSIIREDNYYGLDIVKKNMSIDKIKSCPLTYFPQVYKLLNDKKICDMDMVFYYEKNLCRFLEPIKKTVDFN